MQYLLYSLGFILIPFLSYLNTNTSENTLKKEATAMVETPPPPPDCAGNQGELRMFYWNNITGGHPDYVVTMTKSPFYPHSPDGMIFTNNLETPINFNEYHGALVRGYLLAPETGDYAFNVTGNDEAKFYLSTDDDPANLVEQAIAFETGTTQHTKQTAQMSDTLGLVADNYYYFELRLKEGTSTDFAKVYWQTPSSFDGNWVLVSSNHLFDYTCETICNPFGTPCDDGDASTYDDIEDGACNCYGRSATSNDCIGERGEIVALYYDGISGDDIPDLENATIFPDTPSRAEVLPFLSGPSIRANNYGTWVRGYISVPVSGDYIFNITGDNETSFKLSQTDSDVAVWLVQMGFISNHTNIFEYDKYSSQTSPVIPLEKGLFYYFEMKSKESGGGDHFALHWKTPWSTTDEWEIVPGNFLYKYKCETACVPAGIPCDDGDSNTINDMYDENCNCVGTPCFTPECTGEESYNEYEICNQNQHSNQVDSWQSCNTSPNPNIGRGTGHWIMYDLNDNYQIHDTHIWNYNRVGETGKGIQEVAVDVSFDGTSWKNIGIHNWGEATGTTDYEGFAGADYAGEPARYVLITALSNWDGGDCTGFSELSMNLAECPDVNTPCDDGNPDNFSDKYNEFCECIGSDEPPLGLELVKFDAEWDKQNVLVTWTSQNEEDGIYYEVQRSLDGQNFEAIGLVSGKGGNGRKANYQLLDRKGYQLANELFYRLRIIESSERERFSHIVILQQKDGFGRLEFGTIQPNPFTESVQITWTVPQNNTGLHLNVYNNHGQLVKQLINTYMNTGQYQTVWDGTDAGGKAVEAGIYYLQLTDGRQRIGRRVVKL